MIKKYIGDLDRNDLLDLLVDDGFGTIFSAKDVNSQVISIYKTFESIGLYGIDSLQDIINKIDKKSEITEILGVEKFFDNIMKSFNKDKITKIYLPLKINSETRVYSFKAIKQVDDSIVGYLQLIDDETLDIERLFCDSYKDSLTYLFNKNALDFHLDENVGYHYVGFFDIDNFKYINDNYSHHHGNMLLTLIGKKLIAISDENTIYYRYGGDEFVFITKNLDYNKVMNLVNRIRDAIASIDYLETYPTISMGITEYNVDSIYDIKDAVKLADFAMYKAKYSGKNKAVFMSINDGNDIFKSGRIDDLKNMRKNPDYFSK